MIKFSLRDSLTHDRCDNSQNWTSMRNVGIRNVMRLDHSSLVLGSRSNIERFRYSHKSSIEHCVSCSESRRPVLTTVLCSWLLYFKSWADSHCLAHSIWFWKANQQMTRRNERMNSCSRLSTHWTMHKFIKTPLQWSFDRVKKRVLSTSKSETHFFSLLFLNRK